MATICSLSASSLLRTLSGSSQLSCITRSRFAVYSPLTWSCAACQQKRRNVGHQVKSCIGTHSCVKVARHALEHVQCGIKSGLPPFHRSALPGCTGTGLLQSSRGSLCLEQVAAFSIGVSVSEGNTMYIPTPTEKCYEFLEYIHDTAGLPWWLSILAATLLFRGAIVFPFTVWQQRILARIENAQPLINAYVEQIKQQLAIMAKEEGWSQRQMAKAFSNEVRLVVSNIHFRNRCSSHKLTYLPFWQAGIWLSMTMAIGQMTGKHPDLFSTELDIDVLPALATEGMLWFSDLMQTDMALAVLLGIVNITLVELSALRRGPLTRTQHYLQNVFRVVAIGSIPAAALMPAAVSFYWLVSSTIGLGQLALLRTPAIRRTVGIPHAPSEMKHPLQEMQTALKAKYAKKAF